MIEVLMETVATKLESQGKKLQELELLLTGICESKQKIDSINQHLSSLTEIVAAIPKEKKIVHHHRLHKMVWTALASFMIATTTVFLWLNERTKNSSMKETDIKYRYIQLSRDQNSAILLRQADSLYRVNATAFRDNVIDEEQRRQDQLELLRQAAQKETEAEILKQKARAR